MGIGIGILLLALGAILTFAVNATVAGLDVHTVGWVLMGAGLLGIALTLTMFGPRRRNTVVTEDTIATPAGGVRREVRESAL